MARRITAREFRVSFHKLDTPVLVNDGVWFPVVTAELLGIMERPPGEGRGPEEEELDPRVRSKRSTAA